jgi:hypothetical protein
VKRVKKILQRDKRASLTGSSKVSAGQRNKAITIPKIHLIAILDELLKGVTPKNRAAKLILDFRLDERFGE